MLEPKAEFVLLQDPQPLQSGEVLENQEAFLPPTMLHPHGRCNIADHKRAREVGCRPGRPTPSS